MIANYDKVIVIPDEKGAPDTVIINKRFYKLEEHTMDDLLELVNKNEDQKSHA